MLISPEQWQLIDPLLAKALELSPEARERWLAELSSSQSDMHPILSALLSADARAEHARSMETLPPLPGSHRNRHSPWSAGVSVGPYLLLRQIGRGGMGEVWLARQDRDGIRRDVALKLPMLIGHADHWRERFRRERDILARLQHPHIATLYDAGLAPAPGGAQQPYLAMEYVEGCGLLQYATQHSLNLHDRIELFRQVLSAVTSAHQKLIVHRDLKPANILVGGNGQVKLLDFGIAKLLHSAGPGLIEDELTRQAGRLLTMRYAAPEQLAEAPPTTATDVYALGVILHELLTDRSPYPNVREGRPLTQVDLLQAVVAPPSHISGDRALRGDLDAILLKCLRINPAERYSSVEQFDDDLHRFLERLPVLARRGDGRYRLGRFVARYRLPLAVAAVTVVSMLAGLFVALQQRHEALVARASAERHFASVRELANTFIRDIEKDLRPIPGTLAIRERLAQTSTQYLDRLAAEGAGDPVLALEVAQGYRHLGEVMGGDDGGNLGRWSDSIATLEKAARLLDALDISGPGGREILQERERVYFILAEQYDQQNNPRVAAALDHATADLRRLMLLRGSPPDDVASLAARLISSVKETLIYP